MNMKLLLGLGVICAAMIGGIYAIGGLSGNNQETSIATSSGSDAKQVGASCDLAVANGKKLDPIAVGDVAAFRALDEPLDLTFITFKDSDGNEKSLADWNGKIVLFNLWATWCPPCREEMPWFEELQVERGGDTFQVVPVSIDLGDAEKPKQFYEDTGLKAIPFMHDNTMEAFQALKRKAIALGMPTTLLVDENGCGLGVLNGPARWNSPDAYKLIDAALALGS